MGKEWTTALAWEEKQYILEIHPGETLGYAAGESLQQEDSSLSAQSKGDEVMFRAIDLI